jgi:hypothetical protein
MEVGDGGFAIFVVGGGSGVVWRGGDFADLRFVFGGEVGKIFLAGETQGRARCGKEFVWRDGLADRCA